MLTNRPRGTNDILPAEINKWYYLEETFRQVCHQYGYGEIRLPIFEHTELFVRGMGDTTDVVEKEMYTFNDRGGRSITLRPEGTAGAVRAYLENNLYAGPQPVKMYYLGPMFRYDRPQAGRYRQFHQVGIEAFGSHDPGLDAEIMALAMDYYTRLGLSGLSLQVNSVGCPQCRPVLRQRLQEFFAPHMNQLCPECRSRYHRNPLRLLDCKNEKCQELGKGAPSALDCLCPDCAAHFAAVRHQLDLLGVAYQVNPRLVRGLDYYTHTAFEILVGGIGAQSAIGGGGRYNGLVEICGGPPTPGIGFALGLERIILARESQGLTWPRTRPLDVFVAVADAAASDRAVRILADLRAGGLAADRDYLGRSLKAQMKQAGRLNPAYTVIAGSQELEQGRVAVKDMASGEQQTVPLDQLVDFLQGRTK
ncbi:histidine--tRNA ligase [Desulfurispora thermophila]|uniref:histidine--tRNA ligase n=1 Tax=Desulfurispora thermophila TaxID=265470 RepID=UPI000376B207|nr:histidine--tRNA ligase [Desulfurispora thermophila]